MDSLSARIKFIRKQKKVTQKKFSERICVTQSYISKIEAGTERPTEMLLKLIALEFNISFVWLTTGEGTMQLEDGGKDYFDRENYDHGEVFRQIRNFTSLLINTSDVETKRIISIMLMDIGDIITLFKNDVHFGSLVIDIIGAIVQNFQIEISRIEETDKLSKDYTNAVSNSFWSFTKSVIDQIEELNKAYLERIK
jgi:transcriptional regulator with XRE-family HTH domain